MTEGRRQRADDGRQRADDRGQKTEDGRQMVLNSEVGII